MTVTLSLALVELYISLQKINHIQNILECNNKLLGFCNIYNEKNKSNMEFFEGQEINTPKILKKFQKK